MHANSTREKIIQNLRDCDCDDKIIEQFISAVDSGKRNEALAVLAKHRRDLLDKFHHCNDCIGCLDFLVAQLEKEKNEE